MGPRPARPMSLVAHSVTMFCVAQLWVCALRKQSCVDVVLLGGLLLWLKKLWAVSRVPGMGDGDADVWVSL